jgi:ubiquinone/menaquinone biosynthesis C-methylase UbiE
MQIAVAIRLIEKGVEETAVPQVWTDLGAGKGLFTEALAKLLPEGSTIYALDKDVSALNEIKLSSEKVTLKTLKRDFIKDALESLPLDGILMANSLHYVENGLIFLKALRKNLKPSGRLLLVEYDTTTSNPWVPHPISFKRLQTLAVEAGFKSANKLSEEPSLYNQANIYAALLLQ